MARPRTREVSLGHNDGAVQTARPGLTPDPPWRGKMYICTVDKVLVLGRRWLLVLVGSVLIVTLSGCQALLNEVQTPLDENGKRNQEVAIQLGEIASRYGFKDGSVGRDCEIEFDCTYDGVFSYEQSGPITLDEVPTYCDRLLNFVAAAKFTSWNPESDTKMRQDTLNRCIELSHPAGGNFSVLGALQIDSQTVNVLLNTGVQDDLNNQGKLFYWISVGVSQ